MTLLTASNYFLALSLTAILLLWGVSLWNGTVKELTVTWWTGRFGSGQPLKTKYTGIFLLDFPVSLLVAFFFYGTNGSHPGYQLFLIDAYATLQSAFVWLYIESSRPHAKPFAVANPIIWGLLWQAFGGAIALPLYYYHHLRWVGATADRLCPTELASARALPLSFSLGALLPTIIGMLPTWYPRSNELHQTVLAAWQPDPVWVSVIQSALVVVFQTTERSTTTAVWWVRFSYLMAAASSASGHLYTASSLLLSTDPALGFVRVYVPFLFSGPRGAQERLANGPWLFLQYDLIIISLSSLSWAYLLVDRLVAKQASIRKLLPVMFLVGGVVLGAGAVVSLALFWREAELQRKRTFTHVEQKDPKIKK